MKKSIVCLGIALLSFTTATQASNLNPASKVTTVTTDYSKSTPLNVAIYKGDMEFIKKLVEYGANVNEVKGGFTPLMMAARYNNVQVMQYLISKGAKVNFKNEHGLTAANYAKISKANDALAYLSLKKSNQALASRY